MTPSADEIRSWLVARIAGLTGLPPGEIDPQAPITRYGLDSVAVIRMAAELEKWLGYRFRENPMGEHPTIESLAGFLAGEVRNRTTG